MDDDLSAADFRKLAAKCRRFAESMSDPETAGILRQMAIEYESLAVRTERPSSREPPPIQL